MPEPTTTAGPVRASIVIPTYNGRRFLPVVLGALARQSFSDFEVILVDNNSTIELLSTSTEALEAFQARGVSFRVVRESKQGLTHARTCGVEAAGSDLICFLDDDNEPSPDYVAHGVRAFGDPAVGMLVSRVYPLFETEPPPAIRRREHLLAVNYLLGDEPARWTPAVPMCPTVGAGLWIRKDLFRRASAIMSANLSDRKGNSLISGGDIELGIAAGKLGFDRLYVPQLVLKHHIPASRLETEYFRRLIRGVVRSDVTLRAEYLGESENIWIRSAKPALNILFGWLAAVKRGDFAREYRFIVAANWARIQGPYRASS